MPRKPKCNECSELKRQLEESEHKLNELRHKFSAVETTLFGGNPNLSADDFRHTQAYSDATKLRNDLSDEKQESYHLRYLLYSRAFNDAMKILHAFDINIHEGNVEDALLSLIDKVKRGTIVRVQPVIESLQRRKDPGRFFEIYMVQDEKTKKILGMNYNNTHYELFNVPEEMGLMKYPVIATEKGKAASWINLIKCGVHVEDFVSPSLVAGIKSKKIVLKDIHFGEVFDD